MPPPPKEKKKWKRKRKDRKCLKHSVARKF